MFSSKEAIYNYPPPITKTLYYLRYNPICNMIQSFKIVNKPFYGNKVKELSEIINFCKERLAPFKVPKVVEFRNSLPKSNVGKVLRRVLREEEIKKESRQISFYTGKLWNFGSFFKRVRRRNPFMAIRSIWCSLLNTEGLLNLA